MVAMPEKLERVHREYQLHTSPSSSFMSSFELADGTALGRAPI